MTCSPARLAANRANAQLSTGPKTPEGKERSRANSIKHGLCSSVVVAEDLALVQQRTSEWFFALKPQDEYHVWLVDRISVFSLRIERAERMERRLRDRRSLGAELTWEDQARLEVERVARNLGSKPGVILEELKSSAAGCDWLVSQWSMLAHAAETHAGEWTADQVTLAFNLLGTPHAFRPGLRPGDMLDFDGRMIESGEDRAAVARREIARLLEHREVVAHLDDADRALTESDLFDEFNPELKRLRRYESTLHSRFRWCMSELRRPPDHFKPHPDVIHHWQSVFQPAPAPEVVPEPATAPAPAPSTATASTAPKVRKPRPVAAHPPFDIEPHEAPKDGSKPDILKILITRQEARFQKAEARRESRRRKLERQRN